MLPLMAGEAAIVFGAVVVAATFLLRRVASMPFAPLHKVLLGLRLRYRVGGHVETNHPHANIFKRIATAFENNFVKGQEIGAQLAIYHDGNLVVDLFGANDDHPVGRRYNEDSLQIIFSSSKNLTAVAIAMALDRNGVKYTDRVVDVWPQFAKSEAMDDLLEQNMEAMVAGMPAKSAITIQDVLRHESGLHRFAEPMIVSKVEDLDADPSYSYVADLISRSPVTPPAAGQGPPEQQQNAGEDARRRGYHAITRGMILSQILRRIDKRGKRGVGAFLRDEVIQPLELEGELACSSECDPPLKRVIPMQQIPTHVRFARIICHMGELLLVWTLGAWAPSGAQANTSKLRWAKKIYDAAKAYPNGGSYSLLKYGFCSDDGSSYMDGTPGLYNKPAGINMECPSSNMVASARALAKVGSCLVPASGGDSEKKKLLSDAAIDRMHADSILRLDETLCVPTRFTAGGFNDFTDSKIFSNGAGWYGWGGWGGSLFVWNRDRRLVLAYTMNGMHDDVLGKGRVSAVLDALAGIPEAA